MTTVKYYPAEFRMEIFGHAGFAPAGEDLVCAGASTLMMALINTATDDPDLQTSIFMSRENALVQVSSNPTEDKEDKCGAVYDTVFRGYQALEESYPDHVKTIGGYYGRR